MKSTYPLTIFLRYPSAYFHQMFPHILTRSDYLKKHAVAPCWNPPSLIFVECTGSGSLHFSSLQQRRPTRFVPADNALRGQSNLFVRDLVARRLEGTTISDGAMKTGDITAANRTTLQKRGAPAFPFTYIITAIEPLLRTWTGEIRSSLSRIVAGVSIPLMGRSSPFVENKNRYLIGEQGSHLPIKLSSAASQTVNTTTFARLLNSTNLTSTFDNAPSTTSFLPNNAT
ncbi:uncharacterized protein ATNIH1004_004559 [Aspergillus tanneri]|uniref:FAS1 domain-containing protein n=1 Tax=Aspergillus tanneri TaxID=1220188 RepID=A0A5M9MTH4_9EURO|nr:uncharacterized protein ATNIH1004_004559 [Aspergillus tanneri]KAA8648674.1 hypothetical protein ATNIH1004_004559 [Aspergillus tanneri]